MSPVISVENLRKSFRIPSARRDTIREHVFNAFSPRRWDTLQVLDGVDFSVEPGETLGIMGRNGSGKSTLLRILSGIYQADSGRVHVTAPVTPILSLGLAWNGELTARDNIFLTGTAIGMTRAEIHADLDEILAWAGLERFVDLQLKFYSSGMASRLAFAVAFRAVREVLILDEIFAVGDAAFQSRCESRCRELQASGHTIVLVSHAPATIAGFCKRGLLLEKGRIAMQGSGAEVAAAYGAMLNPAGE